MLGLMYKNFYENKANIITVLLTSIFINWLLKIAVISERNIVFEIEKSFMLFTILFDFISLIILTNCIGVIIGSSQSKKWSSFLVSCPSGEKKEILSYYGLSLILLCSFIVSTLLLNSGIDIYAKINGMNPFALKTTKYTLLTSCVYLITIAIDSIFIIRFGEKAGGYIRLIFIMLLTTILLLFSLYFPNIDSIDLWEVIVKFIETKDSKILGWLFVIFSSLLFIGSYFISTILYKKGITNFDE